MQQRSEETHARILEAAMEHFASQGYNAASVDDICAAAGVSKGAFYHHFPSKQAVFFALFQDWLQGLDKAFAAIHPSTVPETLMQMTGVLPDLFATADNRLPMFLEFWLQASRDVSIWGETIAPYRHYQQHFADLVQEGIDEGTFKPVNPQAAAQVLLSLAVGLVLQGVLDPQGADWPQVAQESLQILMAGLAK